MVISSSCNESEEKSESLISKAITRHGGKNLDSHSISFDFRNRKYTSQRDNGRFTYQRIFTDSVGKHIRDVLNNDGFQRFINDQAIELETEKSDAYSSSINSVLYFALLPYPLTDPAVKSTYLGQTTIEDKKLDKIKVTFSEEGGGSDFEDEYIYWFDAVDRTLEYLAYNYQVEGGGARFRKAINRREIGGILFSDYINYKPAVDNLDVESFDTLYISGGLKELSRIKLENIVVN